MTRSKTISKHSGGSTAYQDTFGRPYLKRTKRSTRDVQDTIDTQINKDNEEGAAIPSVSLSHSKQWLAV